MPEDKIIIEGDWGYAVVDGDKLWIPAICGDMGNILKELHDKTGIEKMIFSAVLSPEAFKLHLKNIVNEWDSWVEEIGDYSHCIEIRYATN